MFRQAGVAVANVDGQVSILMNFWVGLIIGLIVGANIGVVVAGLLALSKRDEHSMDETELRIARESAVMNGDSEIAATHRKAAGKPRSNDAGPQGTP
ncbi:MAG: hypothetical protein MZV70_00030 [Desulfobacterales bacterium]|nr:hypothetical protein [Desulfobacterales bacterium]